MLFCVCVLLQPLCLLTRRIDFEYLSEVPVLTIDVNEDFKNNENRSGNMIEKVRDSFVLLIYYYYYLLFLFEEDNAH